MGYGRRSYGRSDYRRHSKPTPRNIAAKYEGKCACCGGVIKIGQVCTYYPAGTIAGVDMGRIAHVGGLDGNSEVCFNVLKAKLAAGVDKSVNDYAGDGLDARWEDDCAERCGV
jgi:hypothetical protein